jgi:hypothetical protein
VAFAVLLAGLVQHLNPTPVLSPPLATADGTPIEENIRIAEEAIAQRVQQEKNNQS